ncbi:hypothetical protein EMGBS4_08970 [Acidimicrobiaceae bacterium]|nr:hypothetical protein EMGBS4_08970 [Acidimicrobiaceae bacterium]
MKKRQKTYRLKSGVVVTDLDIQRMAMMSPREILICRSSLAYLVGR